MSQTPLTAALNRMERTGRIFNIGSNFSTEISNAKK
jgi:hypothetical protein